MAWIEERVKDWEAKGSVGPLNIWLGMTEQDTDKWTKTKPKFVAGSDEVGFGAIAGPIYTCAVYAPYKWSIPGLADSKTLSAKKIAKLTAELYKEVREGRISYNIAVSSPGTIDEGGVQWALANAHCAVLAGVLKVTEYNVDMVPYQRKDVMLVADGSMDLPFIVSIPKADTFIPQVMAAAIIAKFQRDQYMRECGARFPNYGFIRHVGYGTAEHMEAIKKLGPCPIHRMSYRPFRKVDGDDDNDG